MILDTENKDLKTKIIENLPDSIKSVIEYSTILLRGAGFTGSGVVVYKDTRKKEAYVLTAPHNLLIAAKLSHSNIVQPKSWLDTEKVGNEKTLIDYFKKEIKIHYRAANMSDNSPSPIDATSDILDINLVDGWEYDVCFLKFGYKTETTPRATVLGPNDNAHLKGLVADQHSFILNLAGHLHSHEQVSGIRKYQFLQTGYGIPSLDENVGLYTGALDKQKVKAVNFDSNGSVRDVYDESVGQYKYTFNIKSNRNCTTLSGDSGGPIFGVVLGENKIYLLGLTLGSDFFEKEENEPDDLSNEPDGKYNNAATSLERFYEKYLN